MNGGSPDVVTCRFAQISDLHLTSLAGIDWRDLLSKRLLGYLSWRHKRRFEHRAEVLETLQHDILGLDLDQLLVTGDLTHIGLPREFREARNWLLQLGDPEQVAVVPGNHDAYVASDWSETFALWCDHLASDDRRQDDAALFPSLRVRGEVAFIGLSTAVPKPPLLATGTLGATQLERLPAILENTAQRGLCRVIYLHHSPVSGEEKWRKRLTDAPDLRSVLDEYGCELVLYGHSHRASQAELTTRDGPAPALAVPSASALGLYGADGASYNCYSLCRETGGWRLEVETRRFDKAGGRFLAAGTSARAIPRRATPRRAPPPQAS